jgi:glycosyltransferase involved in cell wall biosynthesis
MLANPPPARHAVALRPRNGQHAAVRVLHLVAADRWTGAAAAAELAVEAQLAAGLDARLAFRAGDNLAERLRGRAWALPALRKERSLADIARMLATVCELASGCDVVNAWLPHDHLLSRLALRRGGPPIVRSVRHSKHLRPDPFHRLLFRGTAATALANSAMLPLLERVPGLASRPHAVLPPAVETRFRALADRAERDRRRRAARAALGIPADAVVAGAVGKLAAGRGHDLLLRAVAAAPGVWALVVGHGPAAKALAALARRLGAEERCVLAGYVGDGLEDCYAAMDLAVFPAAGSDHGHRAIAEAAGCSLPVLAADLPGVTDLVRPGASGELYPPEDAAALAVLLRRWSADAALRERAGAAAAALAAGWTPAALGAASLALYRTLPGA